MNNIYHLQFSSPTSIISNVNNGSFVQFEIAKICDYTSINSEIGLLYLTVFYSLSTFFLSHKQFDLEQFLDNAEIYGIMKI